MPRCKRRRPATPPGARRSARSWPADTRPGNVRRGVLEVLVRNSSVLQELGFLKAKIVKTLTKLVPEQQIRDVRFRVGTID